MKKKYMRIPLTKLVIQPYLVSTNQCIREAGVAVLWNDELSSYLQYLNLVSGCDSSPGYSATKAAPCCCNEEVTHDG